MKYSFPPIFFELLKLLKLLMVLLLFLSMTKSAFSTSIQPDLKAKARKELIPQACLKALFIKEQSSALKWTLRPARGPKGSVRFIYQAELPEKEGTLLSLEKKLGTLYLSLKNNVQIVFYQLTPSPPKKCVLKFLRKEKIKSKAFNQKVLRKKMSSKAFLNKDLQNLLRNTKKGIIYLWSPHMPYSIGSLYPTQKVAKKLKLPLTVLMDPLAEERETEKVVKHFHLPPKFTRKNRAERLLLQGATLHYPNYFFYKEGKISNIQLFGAKGEEAVFDALEKMALN
ncbi:MAG: hypothetical protein CME68_04515 [Halobacteriovoraceae bacterium]|nr:hypothetical protein [Halobacteriovoraceae bacterium]